jgi:flagellar protein FlaG
MNVDARLPVDDAQAPRDHRARTSANSERAADAAHGAPTERTIAGGAVATSRSQNGAKNAERERDTKKRAEGRAEERRQEAERELARTMRLPTDTRLDIQVDTEKEEVKVFVRDRNTGEIVREVPPDEAQSLLKQVDQGRGTLVDRSF